MLKSGPPELPGLMRASVCRKSSKTPTPRTRSLAEMIPCDTDCSRPNGLPIATTQSPTFSRSESPKYPNGKSEVTSRNLSSAMSVDESRPMTSAMNSRPSESLTRMVVAFGTTGLLGATWPSGAMSRPEPRALSMARVVFSGSETSVLMLTTVRLTARIRGDSDDGGMKLGIEPCPGGSSRQSGAALLAGLVAPGRLETRPEELPRGKPPSGAPLACGRALVETIRAPTSAVVLYQDCTAARRRRVIGGIVSRPAAGIAGWAAPPGLKPAPGSSIGPLAPGRVG